MKKQTGFTLIRLMIVVAIIGISSGLQCRSIRLCWLSQSWGVAFLRFQPRKTGAEGHRPQK